jgi:peptide deformylase
LCHEIDHLNGILYVDKAIDGVRDLYEEVEEE